MTRHWSLHLSSVGDRRQTHFIYRSVRWPSLWRTWASYWACPLPVIFKIILYCNINLNWLKFISVILIIYAGKAITGVSDDNWLGLVEWLLGIDSTCDYDEPKNTLWRCKRRDGQINFSGFHIRLSYLRRQFESINPLTADDDAIRKWTCAFCMDLFGSIMFPDKTGEAVPAMYLQFLNSLDRRQNYNWGCAVLAVLYRQLGEACRSSTDGIAGPLLLLQMWSWTRLPVGMNKKNRHYIFIIFNIFILFIKFYNFPT